MIKAKKILGVTLAAAALAATMSIGASADPSSVINLMPTDVNSITCDKGGGTVEMNGSSVVFKAGAEESHFTYPVTMQVDMTVSDYIYFGMESTGAWDIKWKSTALNGDVNPGFSADFGGTFGKVGEAGPDQYGTLIMEGTYSPGDVEINSAGAYTWNSNLQMCIRDRGGRHTPFFNNYRPQFYFRTTDVTGVITLPEGVEMCMPGDNVEMDVELITPIAIEEGLRFAIREGGRTVGSGVVTKINS